MARLAFVVALLAVAGCTVFNTVDQARVVHEICDDGVDNDGDGVRDCRDPVCFTAAACLNESSADTCSDRRDNDVDGFTDCEEASCLGFDHCIEGRADRCTDGVDNDRDGQLDCADPDCYWTAPCFATAPFRRVSKCPATRDAFSLVDDFTGSGIDPSKWEAYPMGGNDRPRVRDGRLDPDGRDNTDRSGIRSREPFTFGAQQPLDAVVTLVPEHDCHETIVVGGEPVQSGYCSLQVRLVVEGAPLVQVDLRATPQRTLVVRCRYRSSEAGKIEVAYTPEASLSLHLLVEPETGVLEHRSVWRINDFDHLWPGDRRRDLGVISSPAWASSVGHHGESTPGRSRRSSSA